MCVCARIARIAYFQTITLTSEQPTLTAPDRIAQQTPTKNGSETQPVPVEPPTTASV